MPEFKYKEFQETLKQNNFAPVYLFIGTEDFLLEECLSLIIAASLEVGTKGFNLDVMYGSKSSAKDVLSHAVSFPMMSKRRVVVVKEFSRLVGTEIAKESVASYLRRPLESTCLILIDEKPDFRKKPFAELKKNHTVVSFDPLWDNQVPAWVVARVR
jgi:DNA polymerase-3 subunit delta